MICYFCKSPLEKFIDKNDNGPYDNHYCCYKCPLVEHPFNNFDVWKNPYHIICDLNFELEVAYIYFHNLKLWLHIFYFSQDAFIDIKDINNICLLRFNGELNHFNYHPSVLENKVKTWITFS